VCCGQTDAQTDAAKTIPAHSLRTGKKLTEITVDSSNKREGVEIKSSVHHSIHH